MTRFASVDNAHLNPINQYSFPFRRGNLNGSSTFASNRFINAYAYDSTGGHMWTDIDRPRYARDVEMRNVGVYSPALRN